MSEYEGKWNIVDREIELRLQGGPAAFGEFMADRELKAKIHAVEPGVTWWRVIDRRLQAMRKTGAIYTKGQKWRAKQEPAQ